jgi:hypothetical protein
MACLSNNSSSLLPVHTCISQAVAGLRCFFAVLSCVIAFMGTCLLSLVRLCKRSRQECCSRANGWKDNPWKSLQRRACARSTLNTVIRRLEGMRVSRARTDQYGSSVKSKQSYLCEGQPDREQLSHIIL